MTFWYVVEDSASDTQVRPESFRLKRDTDGDGLSDSVESEPIRTGEGDYINLDPADADTDGDGLPDSAELSERKTDANGAYYTLNSDPTRVHSDADDFDDFAEVHIGTDQRNPDTDDDGVIDSVDIDPLHPPPENSVEVGDHAQSFIAGVALGETGMPGGFAETEQAKSAFYMLGWLAGSILPPSDARDLIQNVASGDGFEAALDAAGLIPVIGDAGSGAGKVKKFVTAFPSKRAESTKVMTRYVLKKAPDSATKPFLKAAGYGDDYSRLMNDGLLPGDVEKLIGKLDEGESLADVRRGAKVGDEVVFLTKGRWNHIVNRHIKGTESTNQYTSFFPAGQTVPASGSRLAKTLPDRMSESEVEDLVFKSIRDNDNPVVKWGGDGLEYAHQPNKHGISEMVVWVDQPNGRIASAFPRNGDAVWTWNKKHWEKSTSL